ncbi:MAG: universal stress protein [Gammaproteobacteria bacterium]
MYKRILVPVDGSECAFKALDVAVELIDKPEGALCLLHVVPDAALPEGLEEWATAEHVSESTEWLYEHSIGQRIIDAAHRRANALGCENLEHMVGHGDPAAEIVERAKGADAIVIGTTGLGKLKGLMMGSVAQKVIFHAEGTVIAVR